MTFSISARCSDTGMFAIAISSSSPAVAARCAHARAGVGVVATQNITDPSLGPRGLDLMANGLSADAALTVLLENYPTAEWRQLALVDKAGGVATFSGKHTLGVHAMAEGSGVAACGNLLANASIPAAMVSAFENAHGHIGDRVLIAMKAALAAGGEAGPVHSAGLYIVRDVTWAVADLRVDWHDEDPIGALERLWSLYKPQLDDYVKRAIDPTAAPSYGVPGDL